MFKAGQIYGAILPGLNLGFGGVMNPLWDGLFAFYSGNSTLVDDVSANNLTAINGATFTTGLLNDAFDTDGVNDYFERPDGSWDFAGDFTISFWAFVTGGTHINARVLFNAGDTFEGGVVVYYVESTSKFQLNILSAPGVQVALAQAGTIANDTWANVTIVREAGVGSEIFINGVTSNSDSNTLDPAYPATTKSRIMAGYEGAGKYFTDGHMQNFAILTRKWSSDEALEYYNSGTPLYFP